MSASMLAVWRMVAAGGQFRRRVLLAALAAAFLIGLDRLADYAAEEWALAKVGTEAEAAAALRVAVLRSEIEKQRSLPLILAQDPDVIAALQTRAADRLSALDAKFAALSAGTRAGAIYLLDAQGLTLAASNSGTPESFVGNIYDFRPYFRRAMIEGSAEHFAFGTVSRRPGLYLTRRIDGVAGTLGVLVVKTEFEAIETDWRRFAEPTFVTDERSIVLVTSEPDWRFRAEVAIPAQQQAEIRASLQFGDASLDLLPFQAQAGRLEVVKVRLLGNTEARLFVERSAEVPTTGWTLHVLAPTKASIGLASVAARSIAWLVGLALLGGAAIILSRRRRAEVRRRREEEARRELEARVEVRTVELSHANDRLVAEMEERRRAQVAVQGLQDELVQASKLAVLGQIAASVAHEINQPVAAIRTYAENSLALLARDDRETAGSNLATIAGLTGRIGAITDELRAFARKTPPRIEAVALTSAIDGALVLVGHRLRQQAVCLTVDIEPGLNVAAERMRLEQVFVNLLQNAVEALSGHLEGQITIAACAQPGGVVITIRDNGPGLPPEVMGSLFMPFTTTKPSGLGLGLVISHDIIAEFGGRFTVANVDGACFTITLPRAP